MTNFYATNPFTMVYTELWNIIEARSEINQLVVVGNRIRYDKDRDPHKNNVSTFDLPEILIAPEGISGNLKATSNSTSIAVSYGVRGTTGDFRYTEFLAQVQWMLFGTLIDWRNNLGTLQWQGSSFITFVNIESDTIGVSEIDDVQNQVRKRGWANLMRFVVGMSFRTSDVALQLANELP